MVSTFSRRQNVTITILYRLRLINRRVAGVGGMCIVDINNNTAIRLMLNDHLDVSRATFKVGYKSPSQFSHEYCRLFGIAPKRDITMLRDQADNIVSV